MSNDAGFNEAKQLYMEQFGDAIVTNNYLKIALALLSLAVIGLVVLNVKTIYTFRNFKPLVIRIDELGRAEAVNYDSLAYKPEAKEAKYFLTQFCELYYRRNRYTINDDFTKALYFLDGKLANDIMTNSKKNKVIESFLNNPSSPEVDIDVEQVALDPMDKPPYKASVDFYEIEYSPVDHSVLNKTLYTASFVFEFRNEVPNRLIPINPLGLTITNFREDEAFKPVQTAH
jgi:type IV secretion system protein VirB5